MSKSAGNFFTVRDLVNRGYSGPEIRLALLSAHYRANSNFTLQGLDAARETLRYFREFRQNMQNLPERAAPPEELSRLKGSVERFDAAFRAALDDDLNISGALAQVHGFLGQAYKSSLTSGRSGEMALACLAGWDKVLGVLTEASPRGALGLSPEEIGRYLKEREDARRRRDFREADRIRELLKSKGALIKDTPSGPMWHPEG
jgi:cysteinyl-tRNA synthetase